MNYVFDSSAMLAVLRAENGGRGVTALMATPGAACYAHAVNLCEVFYDVLRTGGAAMAENSVATLQRDGIEERGDLDGDFWRDVAALVARYRSGKGNRLALGDAFGLALARRLDADFVTADRGELETVAADGTARIIFIR